MTERTDQVKIMGIKGGNKQKMSSNSVKGWVAGVGLSALAGLYGYTQLFESPEEPKEREHAAHTIHLKGGAGANPFAVTDEPPPEAEEPPSPVASAWSGAASEPQKKTDLSEDQQRAAISFFEKFKSEQTDYARKFDYLDYAFGELGRNLDNAHILGLDKRELASLIRNTSLRTVQELQYQPPADTAFGRLMQANNMRIAHQLSGIADDGNLDGLYAEQVTGMTYDSINQNKIALALPAAKEVYASLHALTPDQVTNLSDDQVQHYRTMTNLVDYVLNSHELTYSVFQRKEDRYAVLGVDREGWYQRHLDLHDMLAAEMKARIDRNQPAPETPSPWGAPGR